MNISRYSKPLSSIDSVFFTLKKKEKHFNEKRLEWYVQINYKFIGEKSITTNFWLKSHYILLFWKNTE